MSTSPGRSEDPKGTSKVSPDQKAAWITDVTGFLGAAFLVLSLQPVAEMADLPENLALFALFAGVYLTCCGTLASVVLTVLGPEEESVKGEGGPPESR